MPSSPGIVKLRARTLNPCPLCWVLGRPNGHILVSADRISLNLTMPMHEFVEHYHGERNHQGLGNELIDGEPAGKGVGLIRRR
jgi:hypothetical protein